MAKKIGQGQVRAKAVLSLFRSSLPKGEYLRSNKRE